MIFRSYEEFKEYIKNSGITVAEAEFKKSVTTPYACYFRSAEESIYANGVPVITKTQIAVELYTDKSDLSSEAQLEEWFRENGIIAKKTERAFIAAENYYETVYEFEVIFDE